MEKGTAVRDGVLLLDNYGGDSEMLHRSFQLAGFQGRVIVIEDDGFLPEDVISVYQYFCGDFKSSKAVAGKPRYFNQINVPDYWEISGNNTSGKVKDMSHERGRIFYAEPKHKRLVRVVDWLDEGGKVRVSDHYNRYGALYARTFFNKSEKRFCRAYFDAEGRETLLENYVTQDIILNRDGRVYVLKNKIELVLKVLEELAVTGSRIFYNTLSTPLHVSERLPGTETGDVLFWQEGVRDDIPGNMQMILAGRSKRTRVIYVQKKDSYEKLLSLGASGDMLKLMGFTYDFVRHNAYRREALICTNSDRIEKCEELITALPRMNFHIAALTEMSSRLLSLSRYPNVSLYPGARQNVIDELFEKCDYYLDINHEAEILSAVKRAFMNEQLIVGFEQTLHNRAFVAPEHIFESSESLAAFLGDMMKDEKAVDTQLKLQKKAALAEDREVYAGLFK